MPTLTQFFHIIFATPTLLIALLISVSTNAIQMALQYQQQWLVVEKGFDDGEVITI